MEVLEAEWEPVLDYTERVGEEKAFQLLSLETQVVGWEVLGLSPTIQAYRKTIPSGLSYIRSSTDIDSPIEPLYSYIQDIGRRREWDNMFKEGRVVKKLSDHSRIVYEQYKFFVGANNRDFCLGSYMQKGSEIIVYVCFSLVCDGVPIIPNVERAHMHLGGFILRKLSDIRSRLTYLTFLDYKGSLMAAVISNVQKSQARLVERIGEVVKKAEAS